MEPYELFNSMKAAAEDWAYFYYSTSDYVGIEGCSAIYSITTEDGRFYSYTDAIWGEPHNVDPNLAFNVYIPAEAIVYGFIHSHPKHADFTNDDKDYARNEYKRIYMVYKESGKVNIKVFRDTRRWGFKEDSVSENVPTRSLSQSEKRGLGSAFESIWNAHLKECTAGCKNKKWPRS